MWNKQKQQSKCYTWTESGPKNVPRLNWSDVGPERTGTWTCINTTVQGDDLPCHSKWIIVHRLLVQVDHSPQTACLRPCLSCAAICLPPSVPETCYDVLRSFSRSLFQVFFGLPSSSAALQSAFTAVLVWQLWSSLFSAYVWASSCSPLFQRSILVR